MLTEPSDAYRSTWPFWYYSIYYFHQRPSSRLSGNFGIGNDHRSISNMFRAWWVTVLVIFHLDCHTCFGSNVKLLVLDRSVRVRYNNSITWSHANYDGLKLCDSRLTTNLPPPIHSASVMMYGSVALILNRKFPLFCIGILHAITDFNISMYIAAKIVISSRFDETVWYEVSQMQYFRACTLNFRCCASSDWRALVIMPYRSIQWSHGAFPC